jgi:hypothetical protein
MHYLKAFLGAAALCGAAIPALGVPNLPATAVKPDPTHATVVLPKDIKWTKQGLGQLQAPLYGDPDKPGPYGILIKWLPGNMSRPHFHTTDRYAYVVSGTWWVSTSHHYDPATTWPVPAGSFAVDIANKVHWDGAKGETVILEVTGMGPMKTISVPETPAAKK